MGNPCCRPVNNETLQNELKLPPGESAIKCGSTTGPGENPLEPTEKTSNQALNSQWRRPPPKMPSSSLAISPSQFVVENALALSKSYVYQGKLGEGFSLFATRLGSYGIVFKAQHIETKEFRAIKLLNKRHVTKEQEADLYREIQVLRTLVMGLKSFRITRT